MECCVFRDKRSREIALGWITALSIRPWSRTNPANAVECLANFDVPVPLVAFCLMRHYYVDVELFCFDSDFVHAFVVVRTCLFNCCLIGVDVVLWQDVIEVNGFGSRVIFNCSVDDCLLND